MYSCIPKSHGDLPDSTRDHRGFSQQHSKRGTSIVNFKLFRSELLFTPALVRRHNSTGYRFFFVFRTRRRLISSDTAQDCLTRPLSQPVIKVSSFGRNPKKLRSKEWISKGGRGLTETGLLGNADTSGYIERIRGVCRSANGPTQTILAGSCVQDNLQAMESVSRKKKQRFLHVGVPIEP